MATGKDETQTPSAQFARFRMGTGLYAIDIMRVKEVINPGPITPIPAAPDFVEGLLELRGQYLPVVDLRRHLMGGSPEHSECKVVIARFDDRLIGLTVDNVIDVVRIDLADIQPLLGVSTSRALTGVVKRDDETILVVDVDGLLSATELTQLSAIAS